MLYFIQMLVIVTKHLPENKTYNNSKSKIVVIYKVITTIATYNLISCIISLTYLNRPAVHWPILAQSTCTQFLTVTMTVKVRLCPQSCFSDSTISSNLLMIQSISCKSEKGAAAEAAQRDGVVPPFIGVTLKLRMGVRP